MLDSTLPPWTPSLRDLWARIERHEFEPPNSLTFTKRLARDKGWRLEQARRAADEYRRFCFLAVASQSPVTPSEEVDEVWHLHLTYTRDYWEVWCGAVLGRPLHHDPTQGGPSQAALFRRQYAATLLSYERFFGPPDPVFWPGTAERFGTPGRFRTVDATLCVVLPRPSAVITRVARAARDRCR